MAMSAKCLGEFQSLIGILVSFNMGPDIPFPDPLFVSIPNRDFSKFQPEEAVLASEFHMFQSLIGILVSFNFKNFIASAERSRFNP